MKEKGRTFLSVKPEGPVLFIVQAIRRIAGLLFLPAEAAATAAELSIDAEVRNLDQVLAFIDGQLESAECSMKTKMQVDVAVEEIFVNIAQYAYNAGRGNVIISSSIDRTSRVATISFRDHGVPFDPLSRPDPDVTLSANDRSIGGLGIYMVKNSMDKLVYRYENSENILTISKRI